MNKRIRKLIVLAAVFLLLIPHALAAEPESGTCGSNVRWSLDARQNLTLRLSEDDGKTWSAGLTLEREAGASDLGKDPSGSVIYCFYEQGWEDGNCVFNQRLVFGLVPRTLLEK